MPKGGKRAGSGRKPLPADSIKQLYTMRLTPRAALWAKTNRKQAQQLIEQEASRMAPDAKD